MSEKAPDDKTKAFLDELAALSLKHGIVIRGCGCCGSPILDPVDAPAGRDTIGENLDWKDDHYALKSKG